MIIFAKMKEFSWNGNSKINQLENWTFCKKKNKIIARRNMKNKSLPLMLGSAFENLPELKWKMGLLNICQKWWNSVLDYVEGQPVGNDGPKQCRKNYYLPIDVNDDEGDSDFDEGLLPPFVKRIKRWGHLQQWPEATFFWCRIENISEIINLEKINFLGQLALNTE